MINKYGDISPRTAGLAVVKLLERGQYKMVTERFGTVDPHPKNKTKTRKYRRYLPLPRASAPLAEGVPPAGRELTFEDVETTLEWYGDVVKLSDVTIDTHEDKVATEAIALTGEQAGETVEEVRINVLKSGTNVFYGNSVASRALVNSPATRGDLRKIERAFNRNKAEVISSIIPPAVGISSEPVAEAYFAMGHTDCKADIEDLTGFTPVEKYANPAKRIKGEVGKVGAIRFCLTGMFDPWLTSGLSGSTYLTSGDSGTGQADVYPLIIVAKNSYAIVPLKGMDSVTPMYKAPEVSAADPLAQIGFVSWKLATTAIILQNLWLARLEVGATANPS